tara:strand:+ start:36730 stop:37335 length:606 start_codon:yes stop_codon:yes gene_type:complete
MKHISLLFILSVWLIPAEGFAQEDNNWSFSVGLNAVDFNVSNPYNNPYTSSNNPIAFEGEPFFKDLFERYDMNWNWSAYFFEVRRYTRNNFSLSGRISFNEITEIAPPRVFGENINYNYYNADLGVNYTLFEKGVFEPFIGLGVGITRINGNSQSHLNLSGGLNLWFKNNLGLVINSLYKSSSSSTFYNYFQHNIGLTYRL